MAMARKRSARTADATSAPFPSLPLLRLLQLASPALPIGAYSYSQGLEWAVEAQTVRDAASARAWIGDLLDHVVARGEAAIAWRLLRAAGNDWTAFVRWNAWYRATRETAELRAETEQMGGSLLKLANELDLLDASAREAVATSGGLTLPAAYALAAHGFAIPAEPALVGYVWSWLENQVLAAVKLVPLGQSAAQRMVADLAAQIPAAVSAAIAAADDDLTLFAPGFVLACARHETQYTRLFRS
jgi:urease accessory protein